MPPSIRNLLSSLSPFRPVRKPADTLLDPIKTELIDFACRSFEVKSFADLGGVWRVDGGYTFYALQRYRIERAFLVDTDFADRVVERKASYPTLQLIEGNFGEEEVARRIGTVDVLLFFDTLLHQVNPDWDQVLEMCTANRQAC